MILMTAIKTVVEGSEDWNALARGIALFKRIRGQILNGKVLHLLEPKPLEQTGRGWDGWDAIGTYDMDSDTVIVFAFRLGGELDSKSIPLHGLRPETNYRISFEDNPATYKATGTDLMANGIVLTLPAPDSPQVVDPNGMIRASDIIYLSPAQL